MEASRQGGTSRAEGIARPGLWGLRVTPVAFGVTLGVMAVALEVLFTVRPPSAYGVCIACHGRDLLGWVTNRLAGTSLELAEVSLTFPLLTVVGVLVGAAIAALRNGELRWHQPEQPLPSFLWGFLAMNFALLAAGCSIRLLLRAAHGEALGLAAFGAMAGGIGVATTLMKWRALR
ncbi:MAG: YeeE/YedE family protein [Chloroflexi bacterium]|nr:YeeE/YedE family protein [Chloroflexota bacterium]